MLELCERQRSASGDEPLDAPMWRAAIDHLAAKGQRIIAFASVRAGPDNDSLSFAQIDSGGLTLLGLIGLIDPPRPEAVQAIAEQKLASLEPPA